MKMTCLRLVEVVKRNNQWLVSKFGLMVLGVTNVYCM